MQSNEGHPVAYICKSITYKRKLSLLHLLHHSSGRVGRGVAPSAEVEPQRPIRWHHRVTLA